MDQKIFQPFEKAIQTIREAHQAQLVIERQCQNQNLIAMKKQLSEIESLEEKNKMLTLENKHLTCKNDLMQRKYDRIIVSNNNLCKHKTRMHDRIESLEKKIQKLSIGTDQRTRSLANL